MASSWTLAQELTQTMPQMKTTTTTTIQQNGSDLHPQHLPYLTWPPALSNA
jgi:hypothetical protein